MQHHAAYRVIDTREASGAVDVWTEHLCLRLSADGIELAVCGEELLGEAPNDWFEEDTGEPLPAYSDEAGDLRLPTVWNGRPVTGMSTDRYLVGGLAPVQDDAAVTLGGMGRSALREALDALDWPRRALPALMVAVAKASGCA